jgi:CDP-diacylglycerol--glycerol-3-phosphate 3-phosphatidyltransferase
MSTDRMGRKQGPDSGVDLCLLSAAGAFRRQVTKISLFAGRNEPTDCGGRGMANLVTLSRLLLLFLLVSLVYGASPEWQLIDAPLLFLIIALDGLDGYVARRRGETSVFGSIFDIAVDRVVELILWVVLGHLGLIPMWVAVVFIVRGTIVDSIRYGAITGGETAFGMMRSPWGRFLVAGRFMRALYGAVKAVTFGWVLLLQPLPALVPSFWAAWAGVCGLVTMILIAASVALCILRGLPVVIEFVVDQKVFGGTRGPREAG